MIKFSALSRSSSWAQYTDFRLGGDCVIFGTALDHGFSTFYSYRDSGFELDLDFGLRLVNFENNFLNE